MRKLLNSKGAVKILSVLLAAGMMVSGLSVKPKADEDDPEYQAWVSVSNPTDEYYDGDGDGVDDDYEAYLAQQADILASMQDDEEEQDQPQEEEVIVTKIKRPTPQASKDILNNKRIINIPDNSYISANGANWDSASGTYNLSEDQYNNLQTLVRNQMYVDIQIVALDYDGNHDYDSDVQVLTVTSDDFPPVQKTKRETPSASFEASTSLLYNLGCFAEYSVDGGSTWSEGITSGSATISGVHQDMEILVMNPGRTDDELDSDIQTIYIDKADKPSGVVGNPVTTIGGTGSLANVSSDEEYCVSGTNDWNQISGSTVTGLSAGDYDVRVRAHGTLLASDTVTVTISPYSSRKEDKPNATFDGAALNLYPVSVGMAYTIDGSNWVTITDNSASHVTFTRDEIEKAVHGNGIQLKKLGNGTTTTDSDIQQILVQEASKPANVTTTPATNGNNGSICNVGNDMQYSTNGTSWVDIGSNTVSGLAAGNYYVRRKAAGSMIASENVTVTIASKSTPSKGKMSMPSASFNAWNMTLSDCQGCEVSYDKGSNWSSTISDNQKVLSESDIKVENGIYVRRSGDSNNEHSDAQCISLSKQSIPSGITAYSATATSLGMISGVSNMTEYRAANASSWITASGNTITGLAAGTYYLRTKGAYTAMPSDYVAVVIQNTASPTVVTPTSTPQIVVKPSSTTTNSSSADKKTTDSSITVDKSKIEENKEETADTSADAEKDAAAKEAAEAASEAASENTESSEHTGEPTLLADSSVQGWGAIEGQMSAESEEPVVVDLTQAATVVPATTIAAAATTNTELILDVSQDMAWSIQPSQITSASQDVDLGINENTTSIPTETLATIETEGVVAKQFTINHNGDFGFTANLTVKLNPGDAGKTAKLFWYNTEQGGMELVDYAVINEYGEATFAMTHASSYAVCVNTAAAAADTAENATADDTAKSTEATKSKSSNAWVFIVIALIVLAAAIAVAVVLKKKKEEEIRRRHHLQQNHPNGLHHTDGSQHTDGTHHTTK